MESEKSKDPEKVEVVHERYSLFTLNEKRCITAMAAYAASFSTLSSFVYYPALPQLAVSLSVSIDDINLTVTTYMAIATIAPTLMGDTADVLGRRPTCIVALSLYIATNIATALSKSYIALLVLRLFQGLAISGIFSVAYGVITDIATPAERGSYVAAISFASTMAPSLGPILGGALAYAGGWPWIFWFLCIASSLCLALIILFLPETARNLVGNGSIKPSKSMQLPLRGIMSHWKESDEVLKSNWRLPNPARSLKILIRKDNAVIILACGLLYVVYTCICASLSVLFTDIYNLNQLQAGLIYLPFGLGGTLSTFLCGPLLNRAYRYARIKRGLPTNTATGDDLNNFPIEEARLCVLWVPLFITGLSVTAFGWTLHFHQHISIPLCLQFITGLVMQLVFSIYNTLLVDKNNQSPAAAQASSNIIRCAFAAIMVAFLQDLIDTMGIGWTFTFMGGLCIVIMGLFAIDYHNGMIWRQQALALSGV